MTTTKLHATLSGILLIAAQTALAAPTTAPAADYSEPRKAVASFLRAKDEAAMRAALIIDPATASTVESFLGVMIATTNLQTAAEKQFATSAAKYFSKVSDAEIASRLKDLDAADIKINGTTATLELPRDEAHHRASETIVLKQTDGGGGLWKIDAAKLFGVDATSPEAAAKTAKNARVADTITIVTNQMIRDINAGKFSSASDAYQEYWKRSNDAVNRPITTTAPASAPETHPATQAK